MSDEKPNILVIDDDIALPNIIKKSRFMSNYTIETASCGKEAIEISRHQVFDFFIVDFLLPGTNGIELCRFFKNDDRHKETPVLFITSLDETSNMIEAFNAGAVDYVIKPVVIEELAIRIKTHLMARQSAKKLKKFADHMEKLAQDRAQQLIHADRLASLGMLSAGLAHEIKNPATFISGNVQTLEKFWEVLKILINTHKDKSADKEQLEFIVNEMPSLIAEMKDGVVRIRKVVDNLRTFSRRESSGNEVFRVTDAIENSLTLCQKMLKENITVEKDIADNERAVIRGDRQQIEQVFINLLTNAADSLEGRQGPQILITIRTSQNQALINLEDNGPGIPDDMMEKVWDPFFTTKPAGKGTGLGLPICRSIIEGHQGQIKVEKNSDKGLKFVITLPIHNDALPSG